MYTTVHTHTHTEAVRANKGRGVGAHNVQNTWKQDDRGGGPFRPAGRSSCNLSFAQHKVSEETRQWSVKRHVLGA